MKRASPKRSSGTGSTSCSVPILHAEHPKGICDEPPTRCLVDGGLVDVEGRADQGAPLVHERPPVAVTLQHDLQAVAVVVDEGG